MTSIVFSELGHVIEVISLLAERIRAEIEHSTSNRQSKKIKITASFDFAAASASSNNA